MADEVEILIKRITFWLQEDPKAKSFNTAHFDSLCLQWVEYRKLNAKQIQTLRNIVERCIPKNGRKS